MQVVDELYALALGGASGGLEIHGEPSGTIYLRGGCVTFAVSSKVPGIAARLTGSRRLSREQWDLLLEEGGQQGQAGALLVERGFVTADDLQALLHSATIDAIIALTAPPRGDPVAASTRFLPRQRHWAESVLSLGLDSVRTEVANRTRRLARYDVPPTACPTLSDLGRPSATVRREAWVTACAIDGASTVRDLAWRNGCALYDTIEWVGELAQAGLCSLEVPPDDPTMPNRKAGLAPGSQAAVPVSAPVRAATPHLPRRTRGASGTRHDMHAQKLGAAPNTSEPVHPDLLRRILVGLKRMG